MLGGEHAGEFEHAEGVTVSGSGNALGPVSALATYLSGRPFVYVAGAAQAMEGRSFDVIHFHNVSLAAGRACSGRRRREALHDERALARVPDARAVPVQPRALRRAALPALHARVPAPPQLWRYTGLLERSVKHVDLFLSPSRFTLDAHRERGFTAPMRHLPYFHADEGIHRDKSSPGRARPRPYFLYVGRLERLKGVHVLIEAFRHYRDADLVIAGEGRSPRICAVKRRASSTCASSAAYIRPSSESSTTTPWRSSSRRSATRSSASWRSKGSRSGRR